MAATKTAYDFSRMIRRSAPQKLAITVLSGGPSGEHDISLQSGEAIAKALESLGHTVHVEDVSAEDLKALARDVDCVFIALHGPFGEDGQIQAILERRGLCYCGSGPEVCALLLDKAAAKARFVELGLPTPRWTVATNDTIRAAIAAWSLPVVVKPVKEGSSLNCFIIHDFESFRPAVEKVVAGYGQCLVEEFIPGMEITVGILGQEALPPIEIRTHRAFYDYDAKYVDEDTEYRFDIDLPQDLLEHVVQMSLEAHKTIGGRDFSRVDWRVDTDRLRPYLLEINTIPGMTSHSLVPKAAARVGLTMPMVCQAIVDAAQKRKFSR